MFPRRDCPGDPIRMHERTDLDAPGAGLKHPMMQRLLSYWRGKCRDGRLPGRQDIDPLDFPDLLPHITMFDVVQVGGETRFRIRLLGTSNVQLMGADCTGDFVDARLGPEDAARILTPYRMVVEQRRPDFVRGSLVTPGREHVHYERLLLPLAADGRTVDMLLALFLPADPPPTDD
jgi:hypothetical protein